MTTLIDGKATAAHLRAQVAVSAHAFAMARGRKPCLRVLLVGSHPASHAYVRSKERAAAKAGLDSAVESFPAQISQGALLNRIKDLNHDDGVDGILVQLPLPDQIDPGAVIAAIDPDKDVDGFHPVNAGRLMTGHGTPLVPCTPFGCLLLIRQAVASASLAGKTAFILGRSNIVGKPLGQLLLAADATVTIGHSRTAAPRTLARQADIVVAAVGRPHLVNAGWVKPGAIVIDVGINRVPTDDGKGRLVGDVDTDAVMGVAGAVTPVPGGVGPMTIAVLLRNTVLAGAMRAGLAIIDPARELPPGTAASPTPP